MYFVYIVGCLFGSRAGTKCVFCVAKRTGLDSRFCRLGICEAWTKDAPAFMFNPYPIYLGTVHKYLRAYWDLGWKGSR